MQIDGPGGVTFNYMSGIGGHVQWEANSQSPYQRTTNVAEDWEPRNGSFSVTQLTRLATIS